MNERTILIHGHEVPVEKIAEAEQMVLAWSDEEEANRDEPCICFFSSPNYHTGWRVVEGGDAGSLAEASVCIGLADALGARDSHFRALQIPHGDSERLVTQIEHRRCLTHNPSWGFGTILEGRSVCQTGLS